MRTRITKWLSALLAVSMLFPAMPLKAWVSDNGDGTFSNPVMWGDYPDNDIIRVGDTYYMSSTSMHLFPGCPIMSSKDLVNWKYESYTLSEEAALKLANNDDGLTLKNGSNVYDKGPWATSLRYSEKLKKFYLLVNMQDGVDSEYAILCVADKASGPWNTYRLDNPEGAIKGLYDPGLLFDKDSVTGKENGDIWVIHGQGRLFVTKLYVVNEQTGELAIDQKQKNIPIYNYQGGYFNEGSHAYKIGDTYHIISTPTWSGTSTKKSIDIQTKDLLNGPYNVKDIMRSYMNFGENGIHQGGIVDVPQEDGSSEWWSVIFQDRGKLGRVPTLQPVYWEEEENGLKWPMMGVKGQNGDQAVVTMKKPNTGAYTEPEKPADSDEFNSEILGNHWQWNHVSDPEKWSLTERSGYMRLHTATVTDNLSTAQNTLRQRVVGPESSAAIKMDISNMKDGDIAGLSVIQRDYNYIGVTTEGGNKRVMINDKGTEQISQAIPVDTKDIWFRASMPRFEYRTEFSYSLDGENFIRLGGRYDMHEGNYVGMGFGAFNYATKELGGYVDLDYFHMDMPDDRGNYNTLNEKIEAERYDNQSYDTSLGEPSRHYNPLTEWTADYANADNLTKNGEAYDLALGNLREGNWVSYNRVDFKDGADWFNFRISGTADGGQIEVRLNDPQGEVLATVDVPNTEDRETFQNVVVPLETSPIGVKKICLVYREGAPASCRINWFMAGTGEQPQVPEVPENLQAEAIGNTQIEFSWDEVPEAASYDLKIGEEIVTNVTGPYVKTGIPEGALYRVYVRAKNDGGYSAWSQGVEVSTPVNPRRIPQSSISIPKFSSEEAGGEGPKSGYISAILDGDANTFWHSRWSDKVAKPPHWFILDLGDSYDINQITMLPRQGSGNKPNGLIQKFTLSYSNTGTKDEDFTTIGQKELPLNEKLQTIDFDTVHARYLKVYVDESWNDFASLAEIEVFRSEADTVSKDGLIEVVEEVKNLNKADYTDLSWEVLEKALEAANVVLANEEATQGEVDVAKEVLEAAIEALEKVPVNIFKEHLEIAVEEANKVTEEELSKVVPVVVKEFKDALAEAKALLANNDATQDEVNISFDRLSKVMQMLSFEKGDKESLISLIDKINGLDADEYLSATWEKLQKQLEIANKVVSDENALEAEVMKTYEDLIRSFLELRLKPNKDRLEELIDKANSIDRNKYTEKSLKNLDNVLANARNIFANEEATEKEVAKAEKDLEVALTSLTEKDNNNGNNDNEGQNNGGNKDNGEKPNKGNKLPNTGGTPAAAVGLFGTLISAIGISIFKKKKENM